MTGSWHNARAMARGLAARPPKLLWVGTAASLTFAVLAIVAARRGIFEVDRSTQSFVGLTRHTFLQGPMDTISLLGQTAGLVPIIAIASVFLWRYSRRWALGLPVVMAGTWLLQIVGKWAVDRPRPNGAALGFPSGHTLSVVVLFGILAYVVWRSPARQRWRCTAAAMCVATALAVAFSRLYLDMHWLSDVGGGITVGLAYLTLAIWCVELVPVRSSIAATTEQEGAVEAPSVSITRRDAP